MSYSAICGLILLGLLSLVPTFFAKEEQKVATVQENDLFTKEELAMLKAEANKQ